MTRHLRPGFPRFPRDATDCLCHKWAVRVGWGAVDDRIEYVVQILLTGQGDLRAMVRQLAEGWPDEPALDILHVIALAAGHLERTLTGEDLHRAAAEAWRMATLVGVDLAMIRRLGLPHDTGADLLAYWKVHDRFFLGDPP